jgi:hypothetical protein
MKRPLCRGVFALVLLVVAGYSPQIAALTAAAELTPEAGDGLQPLITTSELVVGENRFAFGLLKAGKLLEGAEVKLRLYDIDGGEAKLAAELKVLTKQSKTSSRSVSLGPVIGESNSS